MSAAAKRVRGEADENGSNLFDERSGNDRSASFAIDAEILSVEMRVLSRRY
jgi:hypothetical protein